MNGFCPVDPSFSLPLPCESLSLKNVKRGFQSDRALWGGGSLPEIVYLGGLLLKKKKIDRTVLACLMELRIR